MAFDVTPPPEQPHHPLNAGIQGDMEYARMEERNER